MDTTAHRWVWFAAACPLFIFLAYVFWMIFGDSSPFLAGLVCPFTALSLAALFGFAGWSLHWDYNQDKEAERYEKMRRADSMTPATLIAPEIAKMGDYGLKILDKYMFRTEWDVIPGTDKMDVDFIVSSIGVRVEFIEHVLNKSDEKFLMAERKLSEGAFEFDPRKLVSDREQYARLIKWLTMQFAISVANGNQPARWLPPWNPDRVRERLGITKPELASMD